MQPLHLGRESAAAGSRGAGSKPGSGIPAVQRRPPGAGGGGPGSVAGGGRVGGLSSRVVGCMGRGRPAGAPDPPAWGQWASRESPDVPTGEVNVWFS